MANPTLKQVDQLTALLKYIMRMMETGVDQVRDANDYIDEMIAIVDPGELSAIIRVVGNDGI